VGAEENPEPARLPASLTGMEEADLLPHLDGTERGVVVMMCGLPGSGKST
jgi:signal recognition particle GTPase